MQKDPDVAHVISFIGADGTNPTVNSGRLSITLKPRGDRARLAARRSCNRLKPELAQVTGVAVHLQSVQDLQVDSRVGRTQYQYTLEDADNDELNEWSKKMLEKMRTLPELTDVASDQEAAGPEISLTIDRDTASRLGITPQAIDDTLYDAFGQRQVSTIFTQLNLYRVILEVKPEARQDPKSLDRVYVHSATGTQIPLSTFVHLSNTTAPLALSHQGQFPAVTLSFNLAKGSLGEPRSTAIHGVEREGRASARGARGFRGHGARLR